MTTADKTSQMVSYSFLMNVPLDSIALQKKIRRPTKDCISQRVVFSQPLKCLHHINLRLHFVLINVNDLIYRFQTLKRSLVVGSVVILYLQLNVNLISQQLTQIITFVWYYLTNKIEIIQVIMTNGIPTRLMLC